MPLLFTLAKTRLIFAQYYFGLCTIKKLKTGQKWKYRLAIHKFKDALEQTRQKKLGRNLKNLKAAESDKIEMITHNIMQKIVKFPVIQLKAVSEMKRKHSLMY